MVRVSYRILRGINYPHQLSNYPIILANRGIRADSSQWVPVDPLPVPVAAAAKPFVRSASCRRQNASRLLWVLALFLGEALVHSLREQVEWEGRMEGL